MSVDRWVSIGTIGRSVWVSSVSVVGVGQPWLGIRFGVSGSLSQVVVSSSVTVVSSSVSSSIWISSISVVGVSQLWLGISLGFRFWLSAYAGNKEKLHVCFRCGYDWLLKVNGGPH